MASSELPFSMKEVLNEVGATIKGHGKWVDVCCPYTGNKQTIRVNLEDGVWNCFHECSSCPRHPRPGSCGILDIYCFFMQPNASRADAYTALENAFGIASTPRKDWKPRKPKVPREREIIIDDPSDSPDIAPIDVRDNAYRKLLTLCTLSKRHEKELLKRGLRKEDIKAIGYRSVPQAGLNQITQALVASGTNLAHVPGFFFDKEHGCYKMAPHKSGIFIPYFDVCGRIQGLQIRYDIKITPDMDEATKKVLKQKRYRWFSSAWCNETGAQSRNYIYFGNICDVPKDVEIPAVYVTEGGLKAQTAKSLCKTVYGKDRIFVAIPGVSCYSTFGAMCDKLKARGVKILVDAFDSDRASNESVRNSIARMAEIAKSLGLEFKTWNFGTEQKGVDDFLLAKAIRENKIGVVQNENV